MKHLGRGAGSAREGGVILDEATIDRLRELGATDDVLAWLARPDAVRTLLKLNVYAGFGEVCQECGEGAGDAHLRTCPIAAAWRALGDPRGQADIECAREEAEWEDRRRDRRRSQEYADRIVAADSTACIICGAEHDGECPRGRG